MAEADLPALRSLTKDLDGAVQHAIAELDQRNAAALDSIVGEFAAMNTAVTAIADHYEEKVLALSKTVSDAEAELTALATAFAEATNALDQSVDTMNADLVHGLATIATRNTEIDQHAQSLANAGTQLQAQMHQADNDATAFLTAQENTMNAMIAGLQQALTDFAAASADEAKNATAAIAGLADTATGLMRDTQAAIQHVTDDGLHQVAGEAEQMLASANSEGDTLITTAHTVVDQASALSDDFVNQVGEVTEILEKLTELVNAMGPLVELAGSL